MKISLVFISFFFILINSCSVDYDFDETTSNEPELIIVNSLLQPSEPISVKLHKLERTGGKYTYKGLRGAKVIVKEDQAILCDAVCNDSVVTLDYHPKADATYSIEVSYDNLKTARASTHVPPPITFACGLEAVCDDVYKYDTSYVITVKPLKIPPAPQIALWITAYRFFEGGQEIQYNELYANNALIDKRNSVAGMAAKNNVTGSIYYNGFLRVKNKNLPLADEIKFTPHFVYVKNITDPEANQTSIKITLITAGPEYDQFQKTLYDQKTMIVYEDDISSVFYQPKTVYSNIENGLGLFAAINEASQLIDLP
ncbi:MAG: DUF4249 domain-containing protein [Tannerellaceae bacterium]|jgi:hypothetical protein|nr:DUF4249 domain-containing protein [Tannerellaceae bacterium]